MPQPIDMQTELGRATMAERIQNASARALAVAQQREQLEEENARRVRETQVNETTETQSEHVDGDGKRKNPYVGKRRAKKAGAGDEPEAKRKPPAQGDHNFDVSV